MNKFAQAAAKINAAAMAPFQANLNLATVGLLFLAALIIAGEWRLIVDRIEAIE